MPRKTGRRTKLSQVIQDAIVQAIKAGCYAEVAARHAGINPSSYFLWMQKGEAGQAPYAEFSKAIREAEAFAEHRAITVIAVEMPRDWKAAAWYLERKFQDRWGKRERIEQTGPDGGPIAITTLADDQLEARIAALEGQVKP